MRLAIVDPGYSHANAHHEVANSNIFKAFQENGAKVVILAAKDMAAHSFQYALSVGMNIHPYFNTPCYPPHADALPTRQHEVLSESFARELIALFQSGFLRENDQLLFHTGYSFHIAGLARAIWYLRDKFHGRVLISMMFHPGACVSNTHSKRLAITDPREYVRHKLALHTLHSAGARAGVEIMLAVPCRAYQFVYRTLWPGGMVQIHPALGYRPLLPNKVASLSRPRVLLYLGGAKADKGIEFAARLGAAAARILPAAEFVFHFNDEFPGSNSFAYLINELKRAGETHLNVEVLHGNLDAKRYDAVLMSSQIVCVLYDPAEYAFKTSGVFWDALRCPSISWLVSSNTWPASELDDLRIPYAKIDFGDVAQGLKRLTELVQQVGQTHPTGHKATTVDQQYLQLLNSSFGNWVYQQFVSDSFGRVAGVVSRVNQNFQPNRGKILVVRTQYGHFSPLSGPGGFVPHLRSLGYEVDEWLIPMGADRLKSIPTGLQDEFNQFTHGYLRSYQGNAMEKETEILRIVHRYDIVHFVDGEHGGLLCALFNLRSQLSRSTRLIATFHQPQSILQQIIANPAFLKGFDCVHLMSPCQASYFEPVVGAARISVVPHGIAPELLYDELPSTIVGQHVDQAIPGLDGAVRGRKILLTVGNWLRDFDGLLATAKLMETNSQIVFVIVSKGLTLESKQAANVHLLNQGITDAQLHALYLRASLLFLPLQDGAANNAILEAMAHGLPIVTTDLPSTRYYTAELATLVTPSPSAYAKAIEHALPMPSVRHEMSDALRRRAQTLTWQKVAVLMHEKLYAPLLTNAKDGRQ